LRGEPDLEHEDKTMFAVIKTGGKQYRVAAEDVITVAKLEAGPGEAVTFDNVLMFTSDGTTQIGLPGVEGVTVAGEVVEQKRGPKVIAFKKRRRQNSKRKRGHRQALTVVRITEILTGGAKPAARAASTALAEEPAPQVEAAAEAQAPEAVSGDPAKKPRAARKKKGESGEPAASE
jgi:large subunit ribosomal protein L21